MKKMRRKKKKRKVLHIDGVANRVGMSVSWVQKEQAKKESTFPKKISPPKCKGRWLASDIDRWLESQSSVNGVVPVPAKSKKRQEREFAERQQRAKQALERHGINRRVNGTEA